MHEQFQSFVCLSTHKPIPVQNAGPMIWIRPLACNLEKFYPGYNVHLFLPISYLYDAKNMLPGLSFFRGCLQKPRARRRIYLLGPSHEDKELQDEPCVHWGGPRPGTPSRPLGLSTQVTAITPVQINSHSRSQGLVFVPVSDGVIYRRWQRQDKTACPGKHDPLYFFTLTLSNKMVLQELSTF